MIRKMTNVKLLVHQWQTSKEGTFSLYQSVPKKICLKSTNPTHQIGNLGFANSTNLWFKRTKPIKPFSTQMSVQLGRAGPKLIGLKN